MGRFIKDQEEVEETNHFLRHLAPYPFKEMGRITDLTTLNQGEYFRLNLHQRIESFMSKERGKGKEK